MYGYQTECILDVKIGRNLCSPIHCQQKIENQARKSLISTTGTLGYRLSGMKVTEPAGCISTKWHKAEGYTTITQDDVHEHLLKFCTTGGDYNKELAGYFSNETAKIREWFAR
jgi:hypothetical protein